MILAGLSSGALKDPERAQVPRKIKDCRKIKSVYKGEIMPVYEYRCKKCGYEFEALVKTSSDPVTCSKCHSADAERKISRVAAPVIHSSGGASCGCEHASVCPGASAGACGCGCGGRHGH